MPFSVSSFPHRVWAIAFLLSVGVLVPALGQDADPTQDEVLFRNVRSSGGYGAPTLAVTTVNGEMALTSGGQGGWILNRHFVIGGAARGLVTLPSTTVAGRPAQIEMGYGGLLLEYIGAPSELVHYGLNLVVGGGGVRLLDDAYDDPQHDESLDQTAVFVTEAGGRLELNVTSYVRVGTGIGYRFVSGSDLQAVSDADLRGPYAELTLRFGRF